MFKGMDFVYEVYKDGGFKNAADRLLISPSSLSASVKRVEERIGYPVFDRSTRPLRLTECGEHYIRAVEEIMGIQSGFEAYVNELGDLKSGSIRVGGPSVASSILLPPIILRYAQQFPHISIELIEGASLELQKQLGEGEFDMIMDYGDPDEEFYEYRRIQDDYLVLAVPAERTVNHAAAEYRITRDDICSGRFLQRSVKPVPLSIFRDEPFVLVKPRNNSRYLADRLFERHGIHPKIAFEASQQMTAYFTMITGIGSAFVSSTLIAGVVDNPDCCYYKLDPDNAQRCLSLIWKKGKFVTKAMDEFIRLAEEMQQGRKNG